MANRFWKAQPVSGAVVSAASPPQVRLTVASTTGMTTGDVRTVFGIVGTTEANGTWTITVIDATHIDLQGTTFANLYTSGGSVNGKWDTTNTNNWVSTTNGVDYGQTVPGSGDAVTFGVNSGGGTVTLNFGGTISLTSIIVGAFTGTWDNSVNNNNMTISGTAGFTGSGAGTRTIKLGTATYTLSNDITNWDWSTTTGLTYSGNTGANIVFSGATGSRQFNGGGLSHGNVTLGASTGTGRYTVTGANTFNSLSIAGANFVIIPSTSTTTITNAFTWTGSSSGQIGLAAATTGTAATIAAAASSTASWVAFRDMTFTGSPTATDSFNLLNNSGITITPPGGAGSSIGSGGVIGS